MKNSDSQSAPAPPPVWVEFWSSTEYSGFMAALIRELNDAGAVARQRFHISEASYRSARSPLARLCLRFRQYVLYPAQLCGALLGRGIRNYQLRIRNRRGQINREVVVVSTNTFYAPLLATLLHRDVVHLVYDLFPEAMIHSGKWREGSLKVRLVRWITRQTLRRARLNVFLGQRLQDYVESIHGPVPHSAIIEVGADQALFPLSPRERGTESGRVGDGASGRVGDVTSSAIRYSLSAISAQRAAPTILYCGNFGNLHDSQTLFAYWRQCGESGSELASADFFFHCSGPKRTALERLHAELPEAVRERIHLGGGLPQADWVAAMAVADLALVTMCPGSETVVMPSKTYSAMMAGQAILAIAPRDSDLVDLIQQADCGWWVEPGDVAGLASVLQQLTADPAALLEKRENAYRFAHRHLGQNALAAKWIGAVR